MGSKGVALQYILYSYLRPRLVKIKVKGQKAGGQKSPFVWTIFKGKPRILVEPQ